MPMAMSGHGTCSYGMGSNVVDQKPYAYTFTILKPYIVFIVNVI